MVRFMRLLLMTVTALAPFAIGQEAAADPPNIAAMQFGNDTVGPPDTFPDPQGKGFEHPSHHASDAIRPRTVTISAGGKVVFNIPEGFQVHQVAVYNPGIRPEDVDTSVRTNYAGCPPGDHYIDVDAADGVTLAPPPCNGGTDTPEYTFSDPGRYLVICTFDEHFIDFGMYGWVIVQ